MKTAKTLGFAGSVPECPNRRRSKRGLSISTNPTSGQENPGENNERESEGSELIDTVAEFLV
jgi:hypothetical protein